MLAQAALVLFLRVQGFIESGDVGEVEGAVDQ